VALRIATRGSALALAQARQAAEMLGGAELVEASSDGEPGDKSRFVRGVEQALLAGDADVGVHSAKDLPGELTAGLEIAAVPAREDPADVWIGAGSSLEDVPEGARVGTASLRRRAQLLAARPDLRVQELHGNVDTRLRKLAEGQVDALVLAAAGLRRLGRGAEIGALLDPAVFVPAPGQGVIAVEGREIPATLVDGPADAALAAERQVVQALGATCHTPVGVLHDGDGTIRAFVGRPDGSAWVRDEVGGHGAAQTLVARLRSVGAMELLEP
jgi:hydroxymethylbilane synthase